MKKLILTLLLIITSLTLFSQSYSSYKNYIVSNNYTILADKYEYITEGSYIYSYKIFYAGHKYIILATSDDTDVRDIDLYLYNPDGTIFMKDNDDSNLALIQFIPAYTLEMKIAVFNIKSYTPSYSSLCKFFIAYK